MKHVPVRCLAGDEGDELRDAFLHALPGVLGNLALSRYRFSLKFQQKFTRLVLYILMNSAHADNHSHLKKVLYFLGKSGMSRIFSLLKQTVCIYMICNHSTVRTLG